MTTTQKTHPSLAVKKDGTTYYIPLSTEKKSSPSLAVKYNGTTYYGQLSEDKTESPALAIRYGGRTWYSHDELEWHKITGVLNADYIHLIDKNTLLVAANTSVVIYNITSDYMLEQQTSFIGYMQPIGCTSSYYFSAQIEQTTGDELLVRVKKQAFDGTSAEEKTFYFGSSSTATAYRWYPITSGEIFGEVLTDTGSLNDQVSFICSNTSIAEVTYAYWSADVHGILPGGNLYYSNNAIYTRTGTSPLLIIPGLEGIQRVGHLSTGEDVLIVYTHVSGEDVYYRLTCTTSRVGSLERIYSETNGTSLRADVGPWNSVLRGGAWINAYGGGFWVNNEGYVVYPPSGVTVRYSRPSFTSANLKNFSLSAIKASSLHALSVANTEKETNEAVRIDGSMVTDYSDSRSRGYYVATYYATRAVILFKMNKYSSAETTGTLCIVEG